MPSRLRLACERGLSVDPRQRWPSMEALLTELLRISAPRTGRWLALGVAGGLVALGGGLALSRYVEVMDRCTGARAQLEGIWDDAKRQEVETAILGTGLGYAPGTWERVEPQLDGYADAWASKHTEVCEATRVTEEQTEAVMDLRMGCLRRHRQALHAAVRVLATADAEVVEKAVELVAGLPLPTRCDDVERLEEQRQRIPPPEDPQVAEEVAALREQLADVAAEREAGRYALALERVEPVVSRAEALGYAPLLAEAKVQHGMVLERRGRLVEAEQELRAAHALGLRHQHDEVVLDAAQMLTFVLSYEARLAESLVWGQSALPLAERRGEGIELATSLINLGSVLDHQGEYEAAEHQHRRALRILEQVLGPEHVDVASAASSLGNACFNQGKYDEAEIHLRRALRLREEMLDPEHPDVANALNNLALVHHARGDLEQADRDLQRALRIREKVFGPEHPDVAAIRANLAIVAFSRGDYEQGEHNLRQVLRIYEKTLGPEHSDVAIAASNLGGVLYARGAYEEAEQLHRRALRIQEQVLGAKHPELARTIDSLGNVLAARGELEEAESRIRQGLQIREEALGPEHTDVAISANNLGNVLRARGELEQAEPHHQRALQIWERALGPENPQLAEALMGLAEVALAQRRFDAARAAAERAVSLREASEVPPEALAEARFALARALWADPSQRARAHALAEQARDAHAARGEASREPLARVEAWLAEHGAR